MLDVDLIVELLFEYCSTPDGSAQTVPALSAGGSKFLSSILKDFKEEESIACRKVNAMLKKYTQRTGVCFICAISSSKAL